MLFSSYIFLFAFLPLMLMGYFLLNHFGHFRAGKWLLLAGSLVFYSWWNPIYLPLLLGSILVNYLMSIKIQSYGKTEAGKKSKTRLMFAAICLNVGLLIYYKYMDFFIFNVNAIARVEIPYLDLALPLAISFFTLTQIAFIVDCYRGGRKERNLIDYALFVTFFPHLLAGPIVHHAQLMPQFAVPEKRHFRLENFILGSFVFTMGLAKKVLIADTFLVWANNGFDHVPTLNLLEAWLVHYSYTFQLYFDFSGYSDMAIGLGLMFNIDFPINFRSPYKATSIINLWQRWHITLTRFINAYVFKPIMRMFPEPTFSAGLATSFFAMLVMGLWHGAAWTFVVFGVLQGLAIVVNHLWRKTRIAMPPILAWLITFHFFSFTLVIFRATSWDAVLKVYKGMFGFSDNTFHVSFANLMASDRAWLFRLASSPDQKEQWATWVMLSFVAIFLGVVSLAPNSNDFRDRFTPNKWTLVAQGSMFVASVLLISESSKFIYFQF
jgi:alginate O-acetyltransferase complex protein AlgI